VLTVWECALKGRTRLAPDDVIDRIENWILSDEPEGIVAGHKEPQAKRA
jgi:DNA mismatch endonuclease (patch repair protein)